ncbi:MAG: hypothetical protein H0U36_00625 [Nocardioidaceae bacterium]|nr:hypothetical protein [Nocardioidaceae bacterium]
MKVTTVARIVVGTIELTQPSLLMARHQPDVVTRRAIRVLGVRDLVQAIATIAAPSRRVVRAGVAVDLLHAASMLALATADQRRRRLALTSAALAGALAASGAVGVRRQLT